MPITSSQVTVTTTPTIIFTAAGTSILYVEPVDQADGSVVRFGGSTVTPATGITADKLPLGLNILDAADSLYGVVQQGTALVNVLAVTA